MRLQNKIVVITGGGTGIGAACAQRFTKEGAKVVLFGRREGPLSEVATQTGGTAVVGDITREDDIERLVQTTLETHGRLDTVVNNAGMFVPASLHENDNALWDRTQDINLRGPFLLTRRALPVMMEQKFGVFVHISSILGMIAVPGTAAYNMSKGALNQLSRSIAVEYGSHGIRSNSVCPGLVSTALTAELMSDSALMEEWEKNYPIGRFGEVDDIANACLFLASDESSFITGAVLPVDGGYTAM